MSIMKAVVFHQVNEMAIESVPIPEPAPEQVLIKVKACGICGTDVHILHGVAPAGFPLIPGHEAAGEVVKCGTEVKRLKPGDRVSVNPNVTCGYCEYCLDGQVHMCKNLKPFGVFAPGGFAEYAVIAETNAVPIPDNVSYEEAAMVEPLSCCLRGAQMSRYKVGDSVLIHGVGAIGNMNMQYALISGASTVIVSDPVKSRRDLALQQGADMALDPTVQDVYEEIRKSLGDGPDVIMDCSGRPSIVEEAIPQVRRCGTVVAFGVCPEDEYIKVSPALINDREITLCGSNMNPFTHARSIAAISAGRVNVASLISHRFELDEYKQAFETFGQEGSLKILFVPSA